MLHRRYSSALFQLFPLHQRTRETHPRPRGVRTFPEPAAGARGNLKLDESCISNPKSEILNWTESNLTFRILDLRCRIRPISNFSSRDFRLDFDKQPLIIPVFFIKYDCALCGFKSLE